MTRLLSLLHTGNLAVSIMLLVFLLLIIPTFLMILGLNDASELKLTRTVGISLSISLAMIGLLRISLATRVNHKGLLDSFLSPTNLLSLLFGASLFYYLTSQFCTPLLLVWD